MEEIEKIKYAKLFIDKLAHGINPIDDVPVAEYDVVNNVRLSRLFFYVSDILRQVIDNGGIQNKKGKKIDYCISKEELALFKFSEEPIPLSSIAKELNTLVDTNKYKKIQYKDLANWLISENILFNNFDTKGKNYKLITEKGKNLGLVLDIRQSHQREYSVILYNKKAQMFIINNIDKILSLKYGY